MFAHYHLERDYMNNTGNTSGALPYTVGGAGINMQVQPIVTTPQREVDRAMETLDAVTRGLLEEMQVLAERLVPVMSLHPQEASSDKGGIAPLSYTCALANSIETKTDTLRLIRQAVNGMLSDLQL